MKNLANLTKIYLKQLFSQIGSKKRSKSTSILFLVLISAVVCIGLGSSYHSLGESLAAVGHPEMVLMLGLISAAIFVLFFTIYQQQGVYYKTNDYEFLSSLPIKTAHIVSAKFISSYILSVFWYMLFALPVHVVYFMFNPITISGIIFSIFSIFLSPAFITLIGNVLAVLINLITRKLKNQNVLNSIFTLIFTLFIFFFVFFASNNTLTNMFNTSKISIWIKIFLPYLPFLFSSITGNSIVQFLIFLLISLVSITISILISTLTYKLINASGEKVIKKKKEKIKPYIYHPRNVYFTLLKKEFKTLINMPVYFVNTIIGGVLSFVIALTIGIITNDISSPELSAVKELMVVVFTLSSIFTFSVAPPTSVSINVEGEKINILKSYPLRFREIAMAKISLSTFVYFPFMLLSNIVFFSIAQPNNALLIIFSLLTQIVALLTIICLGFLINLRFYKIDWINVTQAVKQSMSVFVCVLISFVLFLVPLMIAISCVGLISQTIMFSFYILICLGLYLILFITVLILLIVKGEKLYNKIQ